MEGYEKVVIQRSRGKKIILWWLIGAGIPLLLLALLYDMASSPLIMERSRTASPDGRTLVIVDTREYGLSFGAELHEVRVGPSNPFLNWILRKKIIETDAIGEGEPAPYPPPPTISWTNANTVRIVLPVKQDLLAAVIRQGLGGRPALDHYGSVRIIYQAR